MKLLEWHASEAADDKLCCSFQEVLWVLAVRLTLSAQPVQQLQAATAVTRQSHTCAAKAVHTVLTLQVQRSSAVSLLDILVHKLSNMHRTVHPPPPGPPRALPFSPWTKAVQQLQHQQQHLQQPGRDAGVQKWLDICCTGCV